MNATPKDVLNYIYTKNGSLNPFNAALNLANSLYQYSKSHGIINRYAEYTEYALDFLNILTDEADFSPELQKTVDGYFKGADFTRCGSAPHEYIITIKAYTNKLAVDYKTACEKVSKIQCALKNSCALIFSNPENVVCNYIDYIEKYKPEYPKVFFYSDLFNLGFMQGIRAERARRKNTTISPNERTSAAAYTGNKHKRRYKTA